MNSQLQSIFQQAIQAFQSGNFDAADLILGGLLQADVNNANTIFELGISYAQANRFTEALAVFYCLKSYQKDDVRIPYNLGLIYSLQGKHELALASYDLALKLQPDDIETLINKGSTCNDIKNYALALEVLEKAIQKRPDIPEAWSNKGIALNNLNLHQESVSAFNKAIKHNPSFHEAWSNKSIPLNRLKRFAEAVEACDKAISLKPDYHEAWFNKGNILNALKRYDEAIAHYDKALSLKPEYAEAWSNKANALHELTRYDEAIAHCDKALSLKPDYAEAWSNKANALYELKRFDEAIAHYDKALSLKPGYAEAWFNKGSTLQKLRRFHEAIAHYDKALILKPDYAEGWSNKGTCLNELKRYEEAMTYYNQALSLKSDIDWLLGDFMHLKMKMGSWNNLQAEAKSLTDKLLAQQKVSAPFQILSLVEDISLHQKCAKIFAEHKYPFNPILGPIVKRQRNQKIRIGYFSADFKEHPISYLTAQLFELHDKNQFDCIGFSFGPNDRSAIWQRLSQAFHQLIDVTDMPDEQIARLSRDMAIDIAVNLGGYTSGERVGIFAFRAAPIQVNYFGDCTMGASYFDYIVSDRVAIPESSQAFYTEKVAYLPHSCMLDDSHRVASTRIFSKQECGLPEDVFIFCCFNNDYKFNEIDVESWSRILLRVKNSILWLPENHETFRINIITQFEKRGIGSSRVIFAKRVDLMADHLSRCALADLFLDTHLYNAHTTALDFLKSGVPVLTRPSQSLVGRIAAGLLNAIGLPEMITSTQGEYEALAIQLATEPEKFAAIKQKLRENMTTAPLFDTPQYTKDLEAIYTQMYERYQHDLEPEHITIS
jgi:predicted O-linked N-acetylglucosamine transferase (SPINDLY family)